MKLAVGARETGLLCLPFWGLNLRGTRTCWFLPSEQGPGHHLCFSHPSPRERGASDRGKEPRAGGWALDPSPSPPHCPLETPGDSSFLSCEMHGMGHDVQPEHCDSTVAGSVKGIPSLI